MTSDQEFAELAQSLCFTYNRKEKCLCGDGKARWRLSWDSIAFFCKHPGYLNTRLDYGTGCRLLAQDVAADTDKCPLLARKMLEILSIGADSEQLCAYVDFIQLAVCTNAAVSAKMAQWITEFYPALNAWIRPHIIASFPRIIPRLEVVEDLLLANVANHHSDLVQPSLEALISFGSKRLEASLSEQTVCAISAAPGLAGKLLACLSGQTPGLASRITLEFSARIEKILPKPSACPSSLSAPHPGKRIKVGKDAVKWADELAEFVLADPNAIVSAWSFAKDSRVGLLVLAMCACLEKERSLLKKFVTTASNLNPDLLRHCLLDLFPVLVRRLDWFRTGSLAILLSLFSKSLQKPETPHHIAQLLFDSHYEEVARTSFIHHLANHIAEQTDSNAIAISIDVLDQCARNYPASHHVCFSAFKILVDNMQSWSIDTLRKYYSTYAHMARSSESVLNELILLVKKQIYASELTFKRIGAIAVTKFVAVIGKDEETEGLHEEEEDLDDCLQSLASCSQKPPTRPFREHRPVPSYYLRLAISMLEEATTGLRSDCSCFAIFLGELFRDYNCLAPPLQEWISDWTNTLFQETFICEASEVPRDQLSYDLDNEENPVCIDFGGALDKVRASKLEPSVFNCAHLLFLIVQEAERVSSGNARLSAIDALQGCPLRGLIEADVEERFLLDFASANLFRQIFNAFGLIRNEPAVAEKNLQRLKDIRQLTRLVQKSVAGRDHQLLGFKIIKDYQVADGAVSGSLDATEVEDQTFINSIMSQVSRLGKATPVGAGVSTSLTMEMAVNPLTLSGRNAFVPLSSECLLAALQASGESVGDLAEFILSEIEPNGSDSVKVLLMLWPTKAFGLQYLKLLAKAIQATQASQTLSAELIQAIRSNCENFFQGDCQLQSVDVQIGVLRIGRLVKVASLAASDGLVDQVLSGTQQSNDVLVLFNDVLTDVLDSKSIQELSAMASKYFEMGSEGTVPSPSKASLLLCRCLLKRAAAIFKALFEDLAEGTKLMGMVSHLIQYARVSANTALLKVCLCEARTVLDAILQSDLFGQLGAILGTSESQEACNRVLEFVRTLQQGTRSLQIICNHLKYSSNRKSGKNASVIANTKRTLETLIFKAKAITEASRGATSFWVGNLKHRDLEGQELCSQVALVSLKSPAELSDDADSEVDAEDEECVEKESVSVYHSEEAAEDGNDSIDDLLHSSEL